MVEEKEAIERLYNMKNKVDVALMNSKREKGDWLYDDVQGTADTLRMAINALEKQIPKKPDCVEDKMWCCPVCDNNLLHKWIKYPTKLMPKSEGLSHCISCGQAIDWSDEE